MVRVIQYSLLIDVGNTRLKWAVFQAGALRLNTHDVSSSALTQQSMKWLASGSLAHAELEQWQAPGSLQRQIQEQASEWSDALQIDEILISNVAGEHIQAQLEALLDVHFPHLPRRRFRSSALCAGLSNAYAAPERLGSDRFASAIAAHHFFPDTPLVVATCGTATTVDAIVPGRGFIGGMIVPGLQTMALSLAKNTAQLPDVTAQAAGIELPRLFADNTQQAIWSGCIHAQLGALQCALEDLQQMHDGSPVQKVMQAPSLIVSGGAVPYLAPYFARTLKSFLANGGSIHHIDNLVLTGLAVVAQSGQLEPSQFE